MILEQKDDITNAESMVIKKAFSFCSSKASIGTKKGHLPLIDLICLRLIATLLKISGAMDLFLGV
ncbi:hypothetical protein C7B62_05325 [Pleurocapsa sp. CCALA 161]|nr:hypothetical protein C7B62_05325 [Pleurocapsa sp. CCALA 161]